VQPASPDAALAAAGGASKPDLTIHVVSHTPDSPSSADKVTFSAVVRNLGSAKAKRFDVLFDFGTGSSQVVSVPALAAGAVVQVSTTPRTLVAGTHTAIVTADYNVLINEVDEANNSATQTYTVRAPGLIDFETDAAGNPICLQGCDLTTAFASRGVTFSFQSATDANGDPLTTKTNASLCDGSRIDPPELVWANNHDVTGAQGGYPCGGGYAGVLQMSFGGAPTAVQFTLRAPDGCNQAPVSATGSGGSTSSISYTTTRTYTFNGTTYVAVERIVRVANASGIVAIGVNQAGCNQYVDDLVINP
jgi:hypothetical protein